MIIFIKIGPYIPLKQSLNKYQSYNLITLQKYDPPLDETRINSYLKNTKKDLAKIDYLLTSNLKRALQTSQFLKTNHLIKQKVKIQKTCYLNEIKFSMAKLCSQQEYRQHQSIIVRQRFISAFIADTLTESHQDIQKRFILLEKQIAKLQSDHQNIACISHTFFIKIYSVYKKHPDIFEHPEIIKKYLNPNKKIMDFCSTKKLHLGSIY